MTKAITKPTDTVLGQAQALMEQWTAPLLGLKSLRPDLLQWATDTAKEARTYKRQWEAHADGLKRPHLDAAAKIRKDYGPIITGFEAVEKHLRSLATQCLAAERQRQTAALRAATTKAEITHAVQTLAPAPKGLQERRPWSWELEDLSKVPREYLVLDTKRLDREARQHEDKLNIPGIKPIRKVTGVLR